MPLHRFKLSHQKNDNCPLNRSYKNLKLDSTSKSELQKKSSKKKYLIQSTSKIQIKNSSSLKKMNISHWERTISSEHKNEKSQKHSKSKKIKEKFNLSKKILLKPKMNENESNNRLSIDNFKSTITMYSELKNQLHKIEQKLAQYRNSLEIVTNPQDIEKKFIDFAATVEAGKQLILQKRAKQNERLSTFDQSNQENNVTKSLTNHQSIENQHGSSQDGFSKKKSYGFLDLTNLKMKYQVTDYQDEFMSHYDELSDSWKRDIKKRQKF